MSTHAYIRLFAMLAITAAGAQVHAEVYKWKDEQGRVQFGDRPPSGSGSTKVPIRGESDAQQSEESKETEPPKVESVVMYSNAACTVCRQARAYLIAKSIAFSEYDVEKSAIGRAAHKKFNGGELPIIVVGDQRMTGFDAAKLEQMLSAAGLSEKPSQEREAVDDKKKNPERTPRRATPD